MKRAKRGSAKLEHALMPLNQAAQLLRQYHDFPKTTTRIVIYIHPHDRKSVWKMMGGDND